MKKPRAYSLPPTSQLDTLAAWMAFADRVYREADLALGQVAADAHDEALYLYLHTLGWPMDSEPEVLDQKLDPTQRIALRQMLERRACGRVPAAYLTNEAWLGEHRFYVDERVIIPRSYFLELIPALDEMRAEIGAGPVRHAIDVCTGSGCLAILLAHQFPNAKIDATDLSADALDVAAINVKKHAVEKRVTLHRADTMASVPYPQDGYDIILSNPPYEPSAHVDNQTPEFRAEPRMAHDGGPDGLVIIRKLIEQSRTRIAKDGLLLIEVGGIRKLIDRTFAKLEPEWLPTDDGSDCVCVIRGDRLRA